jgi:hypothetical protein
MIHAFKTIAKEEGLFAIYKGFQSPILGFAALNGTLFWGYGVGKRTAERMPVGRTPEDDQRKRLSLLQYCLAGAIGGSIVSWVEGPVDFLKCQLQVRYKDYNGFFDCSRKVVQKRGFYGLFQIRR